MRSLFAGLVLLILSVVGAQAQGCGNNNPNCIVPTAPFGTSNNQAASTAFVQAATGGVIPAPVGGLPLYAAPVATGTGTCLSPANACTLATACSFVSQIATFLGTAGPINPASGTYTNPGCNIQGDSGGSSTQLISILGNCSSPSNVIIALSGGATGITGQDHAAIGVNCIQIQSSGTGGTGIFCRQQATCDYSNVIWGAWGTGGAHFSMNDASVNLLGASGGCETITANFNIHWNMSAGARFTGNCATNIPSAVSWSANGNGFLQAKAGYVDLSGWSTTGSGVAGSTGVQAILDGPGYLLTAAAASCNAVLPGSANTCTPNISNGFQDNAGEGITGTGILVGQTKPTITDPIITGHTYAGLPGSPTAGQISHIIDGATGNCSDGLCTTPNATVTGGGGTIDLLISFDGSNWRIIRTHGPILLGVAFGGTGVSTITGAIKGNGTSPFTQAACADLSNGGTACAANIGTSGANVPLLNGNNTWGAGNVFASAGPVTAAWSSTAPTVASGFCSTGTPTAISASNGTAAFDILTVGTATCGSTGTLTMPAATTGWVCSATDVTTPASHNVVQTGTQGSTTAVVLTDYSRTAGTAQNFNASDHVHVACTAY